MATLFQSFRSSTLSKRLLIYALQRLELLDEETLDMENLQFALGRTTTAEFKDVGVRLKVWTDEIPSPPPTPSPFCRKPRVWLT